MKKSVKTTSDQRPISTGADVDKKTYSFFFIGKKMLLLLINTSNIASVDTREAPRKCGGTAIITRNGRARKRTKKPKWKWTKNKRTHANQLANAEQSNKTHTHTHTHTHSETKQTRNTYDSSLTKHPRLERQTHIDRDRWKWTNKQ